MSQPAPTSAVFSRLTWWPADLALAVVLAAMAVVPAVTTSGRQPLAIALALLMTLPFGLRGRWPLVALAVSAFTHLANAAAGFDPSGRASSRWSWHSIPFRPTSRRASR